ncbi:hypothetical protein JHK82_039565 [Glycine max]|nr:hypothetical protein JHK87_039545 [Glycine soja]KAG4962886.1 hypothetical protein JHK86_039754 [Glycine max]KAG4965354.1 hypothetical protein JHK85_040329 [Glycine max]KAG5110342.1 hypothetical protein JHK82_039565 [Glycine max]KAG5121628.1 hypothetical protein JHK84_039968 [Glycine max]
MEVLPFIICFHGGETIGSQRDCPLCIEEFKNGELIQPFGVCVHEFQLSFINSWLLDEKTTCLVCHKEYSITIY